MASRRGHAWRDAMKSRHTARSRKLRSAGCKELRMPKINASPALSHLRVLDLTRVRAGPTCCRILADFGADVIKIEAPPGVDPNEGISGARHGYDMVNLHRNKRSITLNLKEAEGRAAFMRLAKTADIVVGDF